MTATLRTLTVPALLYLLYQCYKVDPRLSLAVFLFWLSLTTLTVSVLIDRQRKMQAFTEELEKGLKTAKERRKERHG